MGDKRAHKEKAEQKPRRRLGTEGQREILTEAAIEVFAELGIETASVEDVLKRANVSRQTFYRCYRNKAELLDAVQRLITDRLVAVTAQMSDQALSPGDALQKHLGMVFDHAASSGAIVCELEREAMRPDSPFHVHRERRHAFCEQFVMRWVHTRFGHKPSHPLVRAVLFGLEQLWLEVAQSSGRPRSLRMAKERAALELMEALLLHSGVERSAFARSHDGRG